ncbi:MAG: hypothetical protein E7257_00435 [Lachnospiraceae bacterium]|nr:hypothetical protein [Lachnospiraceae bacterium]
MEKNKMHKLDLIFIVGIGIIAIISALIDCFYTKVFPVFSVGSVYCVSYPLLIVLLIYSALKYKEEQDKPVYVRWYMFLILPFLHIAFMIVGFIIGNLLNNLFNL